MKVSVALTVLNGEELVGPLLTSLLNQSKKAEEIVIVDGGSKDKTVEIIKHYQKKDKRIKLLIENCFRAKGRNLAIEISKNEIIAMTDVGCLPRKNWLEKITIPLNNPNIDITAGLYVMSGESSMQKALSVFLGFPNSKLGRNFLPTTRSIAFRKKAWEDVGGFTEHEENSAEDSEFNEKAIKTGLRYSRVKDAVVEWGIPDQFFEGIKTMADYAKWDARDGVWWNPVQKLSSHNIKVLTIFARYLIWLILLFYSLYKPFIAPVLILVTSIYLSWAFRKVYFLAGLKDNQKISSGLWGIAIQIFSDIAIIWGFLRGIELKIKRQRKTHLK